MARVLLDVLDGRETLFAPDSNVNDLFTAIRTADSAYDKLDANQTRDDSWTVFQPIISGVIKVAKNEPANRIMICEICNAIAQKCGHSLSWGDVSTKENKLDKIFKALECKDEDELTVAIRNLFP